MRRLILVLAALAALEAVPAAAAERSGTFPVTADSATRAETPARTAGRLRTLPVRPRPAARAFLRFRVRGLTARPKRARLIVGVNTRGTARLEARPVRGRWYERTLTHRRSPGIGGAVSRSRAFRGPTTVSLNVTRLVRRNGTVSIALTGRGAPVGIASRELGGGARLHVRWEVESTAPATTETALVATAGDIACDPNSGDFNGGAGDGTDCRQMATSDLLLAEPFDAVLAPGDLQYEDGEASAFQASFDPSWGRVKAKIRPVPGNHEYEQSGAGPYFDYFNGTGVNDGPAGPRGKGWYSFDLAAWHVIALNSECGHVDCGEQLQWLREDLASSGARCTLAFTHRPAFTSGEHGYDSEVRTMLTELRRAGVELLVSGHEHDYERFAPQDQYGTADPGGVRQFVVGTGGKNLRTFPNLQPNSEARNEVAPGILRLALRPTGYDWRFVPIAGYAFSDAGSGACA